MIDQQSTCVGMSDEEFEKEVALELPERAALALININIAPVIGVNLAGALNVLSINSNAYAWAGQIIGVGQHN